VDDQPISLEDALIAHVGRQGDKSFLAEENNRGWSQIRNRFDQARLGITRLRNRCDHWPGTIKAHLTTAAQEYAHGGVSICKTRGFRTSPSSCEMSGNVSHCALPVVHTTAHFHDQRALTGHPVRAEKAALWHTPSWPTTLPWPRSCAGSLACYHLLLTGPWMETEAAWLKGKSARAHLGPGTGASPGELLYFSTWVWGRLTGPPMAMQWLQLHRPPAM
jgi:hypothetical protein